MPRLLRFAASAAFLVSVATLAARLFGFVRWLVFSPTVGAGTVGTAYQSANLVPNVLYEVVAGGALAGAVVPLLAAPLAAADRASASRIASALLTWSVTLTLPLAVAVAVFREPLAAMLSTADGPEVESFLAGFLLVFAPQLVLYAIGGVLTGVLQAHRRFLWPAFMPLVSSVTVIGVYVGYAQVRGPDGPADMPGALALLAWGTTAGVAAMTLPLALPTLSTGIRLRLTWRFPTGVAARAVRLAAAGMSVLLAQQATVLIIMLVSNRVGGVGVFVVFSYVQAVYLLPYAVLAVPVATVAFPKLASLLTAGTGASQGRTAGEAEQRREVDAFIAGTTRLVLVLGFAGAAVLAAAAMPLQDFFSVIDAAGADEDAPFGSLGATVRLIAWAVPGWCLVAWGTRVFYALERSRFATASAVTGWALVAVSVLVAVPLVGDDPAARTLVSLGLAHAVGMTAAGVSLLAGISRVRARAALAGLGRTLTVVLAAAVIGTLAGTGTAAGLGAALGHVALHPAAGAVLAGAGAGLVALAVMAIVVYLADRRTLLHATALR